MLKATLLGGALALGLGAAAFAQPMGAAATMQMSTPQFITAASQSDEFEIQEGHMAATMGKSADVRRFGAEMVRDHTMTTQNLHKAIMKAGMSVPPPPPLRPDQQQMISQLQGMSGAGFDRTYVQQQMKSHQEALAAQEGYSRNGDAPSIKMAATKTVPIVERHIQMLQQMQGSMGQ